MEIIYDKDYLSDLYHTGKTDDKKHRFQPQIIRKYIRVIDTLKVADRIEDLYRINSLNYEMLTGDKNGIESVRVNDQYRIEFKSSTIVNETVVTICNIIDLTNHYSTFGSEQFRLHPMILLAKSSASRLCREA